MKSLLILLLTLCCSLTRVFAQSQNYQLTGIMYFDVMTNQADKANGYLSISRTDTVITFELRDYYNDMLYVMRMRKTESSMLADHKYERFTSTIKKNDMQALIFYTKDDKLKDITLFRGSKAYKWSLRYSDKKLE